MIGGGQALGKLVGGMTRRGAQPIDLFVTRNARQPWPERPLGIIGVAPGVDGDQRVLHRILYGRWWQPPGEIARQSRPQAKEQAAIRGDLTGLGRDHQATQVMGIDVSRRWRSQDGQRGGGLHDQCRADMMTFHRARRTSPAF
jgi:hypothetical protein